MGQKTAWFRTEDGQTLEHIAANSLDSTLTLTIPIDTLALDANEEPLSTINVTIYDPLIDPSPVTPPTNQYLIYVYDFKPDGASFSKPIDIEIAYDPTNLPESPDEVILKTYAFNDSTNEWELIPGLSYIDTNTVIFSTKHFSTYILTADSIEGHATPIPMLLATNANEDDFILIVFLIIWTATSLVFFLSLFLKQFDD